jgi:hypothetical protein
VPATRSPRARKWFSNRRRKSAIAVGFRKATAGNCEDENLRAEIEARCGSKSGDAYQRCYAEVIEGGRQVTRSLRPI